MNDIATASGPRTPQHQASDAGRTQRMLDLLAAGVPLSLLIDLATVVDSADFYTVEAGSASWLPAVVA